MTTVILQEETDGKLGVQIRSTIDGQELAITRNGNHWMSLGMEDKHLLLVRTAIDKHFASKTRENDMNELIPEANYQCNFSHFTAPRITRQGRGYRMVCFVVRDGSQEGEKLFVPIFASDEQQSIESKDDPFTVKVTHRVATNDDNESVTYLQTKLIGVY